MVRRYVRSSVEMFPPVDVPLREFPAGEGPPLHITASGGPWTRLGLGQAALVRFGGDDGGAFAWGMTTSRIIIWVRGATEFEGVAYCHHAGAGPLDARVLGEAMRALECDVTDRIDLHVIVASPRLVAAEDEAFLRAGGFRPERIFTYSRSMSPQFGVSSKGCVGEPI